MVCCVSKILIKIKTPIWYSIISEAANNVDWFLKSLQLIPRLSLLFKYLHLIQAAYVFICFANWYRSAQCLAKIYTLKIHQQSTEGGIILSLQHMSLLIQRFLYIERLCRPAVLSLNTEPAILKCKAWNMGKSAKILLIGCMNFQIFWGLPISLNTGDIKENRLYFYSKYLQFYTLH